MKALGKALSSGRMFSKKWVNEKNFPANLEGYKSDVLNQTLLQF